MNTNRLERVESLLKIDERFCWSTLSSLDDAKCPNAGKVEWDFWKPQSVLWLAAFRLVTSEYNLAKVKFDRALVTVLIQPKNDTACASNAILATKHPFLGNKQQYHTKFQCEPHHWRECGSRAAKPDGPQNGLSCCPKHTAGGISIHSPNTIFLVYKWRISRKLTTTAGHSTNKWSKKEKRFVESGAEWSRSKSRYISESWRTLKTILSHKKTIYCLCTSISK